MSLVKDPLARAHSVKTPLQARRLRDDLDIELALNTDLPADWEKDADKAVDVLNERYGRDELDKIDPETVGVPKMSKGASKGLTPPKPKPAAAAKPAGAKSRPAGSSKPRVAGGRRPSPPPAGGGGRRRRGGFFSGKAAEQTGIPSATRSASQMALQTLGLLIFLSVAYLLLRNSQGSGSGKSAVELFGGSVSGFVRAVVAPVDPLRGRSVGAKAAGAKAAAGAPPAAKSANSSATYMPSPGGTAANAAAGAVAGAIRRPATTPRNRTP